MPNSMASVSIKNSLILVINIKISSWKEGIKNYIGIYAFVGVFEVAYRKS